MESSEYDCYYEPYRRVPMNSATSQRDYNERNSTGTPSTYSIGSGSGKPTMTTTYIDGMTIMGQEARPYSMKDIFPKGKSRQKPFHSSEKKISYDAYMSLLPTDASTVRSAKPRSSLFISTATQATSNLPEVLSQSANIPNTRVSHTAIVDDDSQPKCYTRCATTQANSAWVQRFKSINESQMLSDFFRDEFYENEISLKKRPYPQLLVSSSLSSFPPLFNKRRREKC